MSYEEVAALVERMSGERLLSDQKIGQIVSAKALELSQQIHQDAGEILAKTNQDEVRVNSQVNIYNPEETEILLFDDGIQVKRQKEQREPKCKVEKGFQQGKSIFKSTTTAITTALVLLQKTTGEFE